MTTRRPAARILRIRIRRVVVRACLPRTTPPACPAWCCQDVSDFRYADDMRPLYHRSMRVLIVEDEPYMAEAIRDGLRLEAIAADIAGDGHTALKLLRFNAYDIAVLDRDIPGPSGDEIAERIVASGSGMPILLLTARAPAPRQGPRGRRLRPGSPPARRQGLRVRARRRRFPPQAVRARGARAASSRPRSPARPQPAAGAR